MAETFYRIKNSDGEYLGVIHDSMEWDAARQASTWGDYASADDMAKFARKHYDPTARVVKTTLKRSRHADAWVERNAALFTRHSERGTEIAYVCEHTGNWYWSAERGKRLDHGKACTAQAARGAADAWLRKLGWVLA